MTSRWFAKAVAALGVVLASLLGVVTPVAALGQQAVPPVQGAGVLERLGGCLAAGGQGRVLLVLDNSASLRGASGTDPDFARITAANYLIDQLAGYVDTSGAQVDLAIASFADSFDVARSWTALNGNSAGGLQDDIGTFRTTESGFETDYWTAVDGARRYLTDGSTGRDCRAFVWFSDGRYDLDQRDSSEEQEAYGTQKDYGPAIELTSDEAADQIERAGIDDLCRPGGLADQVRRDAITTIAVGLKPTGSDQDFSLMEGIATGSPVEDTPCGAIADPTPGTFTLASDISDLLFAFDAVSDPENAATVTTTPLCQGVVCPAGTHRFVLDSSITKVHILAGLGSDSGALPYEVQLLPPGGGDAITLDPRSSDTSTSRPGFSATATSLSDSDLQVDLAYVADRGWVGEWRLAFVDPASRGSGTARSNIHLYGDIEPAWLDSDVPLVVDETASIQLGLVREGDQAALVARDLVSDVRVDADLVYPDGTRRSLASGLSKTAIGRPVEVSLDGATPGAAVLRLGLRLTTASAAGTPGTALEPSFVDLPVTVAPPADFPRVASIVSFGSTEEPGSVSRALAVQGEGCVWLAEVQPLTTPQGVRPPMVTSSASDATSCVTGDLPLKLSLAQVGNGLVSGDLTVMTTSVQAGAAPVPATVRYDLEVQRPRSAVFWPLLVAITALGVLIPVALLYLVKWGTAKIPGSAVAVGNAAGHVDDRSAFIGPGSVTEQELRTRTLVGADRRALQLNSTSRVRTKIGLGLTEPGFCAVRGQHSVSSRVPGTARGGTRAKLPLAVQDSWIALLDDSDPHRGPVEVVFIVSPTSGRLPELLADAQARLPELVSAVRSRLGAAATPSPQSRDSGSSWGADSMPASGSGNDDSGWGTSANSGGPGAPSGNGASPPRSDPGPPSRSKDNW